MGFLLSVFESLSAQIGTALTHSTMETITQLLQRYCGARLTCSQPAGLAWQWSTVPRPLHVQCVHGVVITSHVRTYVCMYVY